MVNNPSEQVIQQAIADAKSGNKEAAKKALSQLVKKDPNNARGWYLLSQVVEKKEQAVYCLEKLLEIQPKNQQAIKRLEELRNPPQQLIDELFSDSIEKAPNELHEPIKKKT